MENLNDKYQKHLTLQDRYDIEEGLNHTYSLTYIAEIIRKDKSTISKEIRKHRIGDTLRTSTVNDCLNRYQCSIQHLCNDCSESRSCHRCHKADCRGICLRYRSETCRYTRRAPYVCNGCGMIYDCKQPHFYYRANASHTAYIEQLRISREGISLSRQQLYELDCLLTPLIQQGQSIAHICAVHKDEIPCSMKTIYNYIDQGIFTARNIDLPKKVKYKARKKKRTQLPKDYSYREYRTYKDFQNYIAEYSDMNVVELDTVHGSNHKGKVIMTILFRNSSLMLIFLLNECSQICVKETFDTLDKAIGVGWFSKKLSPHTYRLCRIRYNTDNGTEFQFPARIECDEMGEIRTKVFFCNPNCSWQKGMIEKNHEYIRYVIPKGKSLDSYSLEDAILLMNHINSEVRDSLNGCNPFKLSLMLLNNKLHKLLSLKEIPCDEVYLRPALLKK